MVFEALSSSFSYYFLGELRSAVRCYWFVELPWFKLVV